MKRLTPLVYGLILLFTLAFGTSLTASAHPAHPASPAHRASPAWDGNYNCYEDECDGAIATQTRCPTSGLHGLWDYGEYENSGRLDMEWKGFKSSDGTTHCNTFWSAVDNFNTYVTWFHIYTYRIAQSPYPNEDNTNGEAVYNWPYYSTGWNNGFELGYDDVPVGGNGYQDCFYNVLDWAVNNGNETHEDVSLPYCL